VILEISFQYSLAMSIDSRQRSLSLEALYQPIPQAPVTANSERGASVDISLDGEDLSASTSTPKTDARLRWIHFILGCAVLLPWNGIVLISERPSGSDHSIKL